MISIASDPSLARATLGRRLGGIIGSPVRWLLRTLTAHETRVHLHALSDHTLRDMGFMRDQIDDVLRGTVRRQCDTLRHRSG